MEKFDLISLALGIFAIWLAVAYKRSADKVNTDTSAKLVSIENNTKSQLTAVQTDINTRLTAIQTDINTGLTAVQTDVSTKLTTVQTNVNTNLADTRSDISNKLIEIKTESSAISKDIMSELKLYNEAFRKGEITNNVFSGKNSINSKVSDIKVGDNTAE